MKGNYNDKEKVMCKICGKRFHHVMSHCWKAHKILSRDYKKMFGLNVSKGLCSKPVRKVISDNVLAKPEIIKELTRKGKKVRFKKGDKWNGNYKRSPETLKMLSHIHEKRKRVYKNCEDCGKKIIAYRWRLYCDECGHKRGVEAQNTPEAKKKKLDWSRRRRLNPEYVKDQTEKHRIYVAKNKE